ncbi:MULTISPECIES: ROK family transcriptional regulator [unclassified Streptomyces]|uniref:ROK family transcriptional regulator n=1 Tax=unclassified Streptomyces TaxID=2593676 RepID=UPI00380F9B6B
MRRTSRDIRTANRHEALRQIIARSPVSRRELAAATGLSLATVATLVGELLGLGVITEVGYEDSAGGRPRGLVAVDASGGALVGVDITETYVRVELFDLALNRLGRAEEPACPAADPPARVADRVAAAVGAVVARAGMPVDRVLGAGVSVPGQVDRETGRRADAPPWGWYDVPLLDLLAQDLPYALYLDSPPRACAVAELWFGAARGHEDAVVVSLGSGVGAGLVLGGALHRGVSNSAGAWGHTTLVPGGRICRCGRQGCVEAYVGAPGILRTLRELGPHRPPAYGTGYGTNGDGGGEEGVAALGRALAVDDPVAVAVVRDTARRLAAGVADLVDLLDPEVVVLSGWVAARLGERLADEVREAVARHAPRRASAAIALSPLGPLPGDPVCLGAATLALEGALRAVGAPGARAVRVSPRGTPAGTRPHPR